MSGIKMNYAFTSGNIVLNDTTLEKVAQYFDEQHVEFVEKTQLVHRKIVFKILNFLIRICPVDTGRLRGSFTPLFDKYGNSSFARWIADSSMAPYPRKTPKKGFNPEAVQEGKDEGQFIDQPLDTTIMTNVAYAADVDATTGYIARMLVYGNEIYNSVFVNFLEAAAKQGMIPAVDPNAEDDQEGI
jgi:hypothetical protein